jgi:GNAT superfamily N-acetyltransferase
MPQPVPAVLLGRLAVDEKEQGHGLGRYLVRDANPLHLMLLLKDARANMRGAWLKDAESSDHYPDNLPGSLRVRSPGTA